ncbi:Protein CBG24731 [Caenorhabditis briggsae]|uniref:Protein CBG24731 n=1 Tax=Caenorhabditis briggsae TaxID=6238 RepID=A8WLC5_CAEBR|nr:Protein CBG24731 [Caenorhabditis briggsae]CAP21270.2 Protein CBG24731 [Caenorhabditis briggsae]
MAHPPDRYLTTYTQNQRVYEWLQSISKPNIANFLDMDADALLVFVRKLDRSTRSKLEQSCRFLCNISRCDKPHLQQLSLQFTTTWNHDQFAEITAIFDQFHTFHAVFMWKMSNPLWITGGWSTDKQKMINSGIFPPEKLKLNTNYMGLVPQLKLKKFILIGANNLRFINSWLNSLQPNIPDPIDNSRKTIDIEFIDVEKSDLIMRHPLMKTGIVNLKFHKNSSHFQHKSLNIINVPYAEITARQVSSEAVNLFLKRWARGEMTEAFEYLHITETTQWPKQEIQMRDVLKGLRYQIVELQTDVKLKILSHRTARNHQKTSTSSMPTSSSESSSSEISANAQIFQICGPRPGFCIHEDGEFIFEVPKSEEIQKIQVFPPILQTSCEEFERQKNRIYMELFRKKLIKYFN